MIVAISPQVYGNKFMFQAEKCDPTWNEEFQFWVVRHNLGDCDPEISELQVGNER